jgi:uncharacterized protein
MKYGVGHTGRTILVRLDEDEDVLSTLKTLSKKEKIRSGLFFIIGNLKKGALVSGAEKARIPVHPLWNPFKKNHEILGIGTIFQMDGQPEVHLHAALGRGKKSKVGCLRDESNVFLISEIIVFELLGLEASREKDKRTGYHLLNLK